MKQTDNECVCGYSCTPCDHYGKECHGCSSTRGTPFWTSYAGIDCCPVYGCCVNEKHLPHCGKCPELMCERFTRFRDPGVSEEESSRVLARMEKELRARR